MVGEVWILQQEKVVVHTCNYTKEWLDFYDVDVMGWTSKSPVFNIIKNV